MRRSTSFVATVAACAIVLAPSVGFARAGSGGSMGSRGGMTYSAPPSTRTAPSYAAPMERSMTQPGPSYGSPGYAAPGLGSRGFGGGGSFMSGMMGGLIGAGIGGMLFGHGMFGGISGIGGFLGLLLQIALVVWLVRLAMRFFARRPATAGGPNILARGLGMGTGPLPMGGGGGARPPARPAVGAVQVTPQDFQNFDKMLHEVQAAWTAHDLPGYRGWRRRRWSAIFPSNLASRPAAACGTRLLT